MRKWVLSRVIQLCSACCSTIFFLLPILLVIHGCGTANPAAKESRLVSQYQRTIGCQDYARLRPAPGEHEKVLAECKNALQEQYEFAQIVTAFVYRSLNRGVLFVHLVFRQGEDNPRQSYNYLIKSDEQRILGGYPCGI